jgi:hypothetical protein
MTVTCENEACTEYQIVKSVPDDFRGEEIQCGACQSLVEEVDEDG